jgi:hypothetical protein|tara:strand:- start:2142 stop:2294 length:153 start_codon:yes stop_codon:yes gene_type:complete
MIELLTIVDSFDLPLVVIILLYDKIKSNGLLKKAVENNTNAIKNLQRKIK